MRKQGVEKRKLEKGSRHAKSKILIVSPKKSPEPRISTRIEYSKHKDVTKTLKRYPYKGL